MKYTAGLSLLLFLALTACASSIAGDPRLDGVWVSDKDKTLANIRAVDIPADRVRFLRENLGQLSMCFSGTRIATFFAGTTPKPGDIETYRVSESSPSSVTVKVGRGTVRTLHLEGECLRHIVPDWGYEEYFCRKSVVENPCK